jgi:4-amino-4-deoxy-L-arabinose transferase-like glycosyltransferase
VIETDSLIPVAEDSRRSRRRSFALVLLLIALGAFGLRLGYALTVSGTESHLYDWVYYRGEAKALAAGDGFVEAPVKGKPAANAKPAADHPPLEAILLAPVAKATGGSDTAMRVFNCVLGALGVALIGLLGRELDGEATGLVAASIAAVYPNLWVNDALIMAESLTVVIATGAVLLALRLKRRPSVAGAVGLGAVCGLAALTRSELILLLPALCIPTLLARRGVGRGRRLQFVVAAVAAFAVLVGPWVAYNMSRFERPVLISTNFDLNLAGSSCSDSYRGDRLGSLGLCTFLQVPAGADQSVVASAYRKQALDYIKGHLSLYPTIVLARIGRTWSVFRPLDGIDFGQNEGRPRWVSTLGLVFYYPLLLLAVVGVVLRRRRRAALWQILLLPSIVTVSMLVSYGQPRYRVSAEPAIVILAAVAIVAAWSRLARRTTTQTTAPARADAVEPASHVID